MNIYDGKQMRQMTAEEEQKWAKERERFLISKLQSNPSELREQEYNMEPCVPWGGDMLTVTEAAQQWSYYAAEGNTVKMNALTALIAEAKAEIRTKYPDA